MSIESILKKESVYNFGIAHMFTERVLDDFFQTVLKQYGLTIIEWLVLSQVAQATKQGGIRVTDLATEFEVKTTYITSVLNGLRAKEFVETRFDENDGRVRLAVATKRGGKEVPAIERVMRKELNRLIQNEISPDEMEAYLKVNMALAKTKIQK